MDSQDHPRDGRNPEPGENHDERLNRNLAELLSELRIALPGVQVLFAFLLAVPFSQRFARAGSFEHAVYLATVLLTVIASALLIAPSAYHRLEFRLGDREHIVMVAHRLTLAGLASLALAMTTAVLLVTRYLFSVVTTVVVVSLVGAVFVGLWYVLPLRRRWVHRPDQARQTSEGPQ